MTLEDRFTRTEADAGAFEHQRVHGDVWPDRPTAEELEVGPPLPPDPGVVGLVRRVGEQLERDRAEVRS